MGYNFLGRKTYAQAIIEKHSRAEDNLKITFKKKEMKYLDLNYNDALVVSMRAINTQVKRVMTDMGSSVDVLYFNAFQKLGLSTNTITLITSSLMRFIGNSFSPLRSVNLHVTFRDKLCSNKILARLMVMDIPSVYNVIIG